MNREDREAEKRLGKGRGHFSSKVWTSYGKTVDRKVCSQCIGICCNALRDLVDRLVEKNFLIPGAQSPTVSCCCFRLVVLCCFQDFSNAVRRVIWRLECWRVGNVCVLFLMFIVFFIRGCHCTSRGGSTDGINR